MDADQTISVLSQGVHIPAACCELTAEAFDGIWLECVKGGMMYQDAYDQLEQGHVRIFGRKRYATYNSFRMTRARRLKK